MKIAVVNGNWSVDIGNAFAALGANWLVETAAGKQNVSAVPALPPCHRLTKHAFDVIGNIESDLVIFSGCELDDRLADLRPTLERLGKRGVRVAYLDAHVDGQASLGPETLAILSFYRPVFIVTRDASSHRMLEGKVNTEIQCGVCTTAFLPEAVAVAPLQLAPTYIFCFQPTERRLEIVRGGFAFSSQGAAQQQAVLNGRQVVWLNPSIGNGAARNPLPNSYRSDLPWGYLSLLQAAETVVSDHAGICAGALALGGSVQYLTSRAATAAGGGPWLEHLAGTSLSDRPGRADRGWLDAEKIRVTAQLRAALSRL